ncbi:MAG: hypothetical protein JNL74_11480 [Fibrobacteres bacterium]|nr:hypothetical protein [Fibrobacterota bacterium]
MTRKERLMNTLAGKTVDIPAVCFYEINGLDQNENDLSPFNIYSDPSWKPLLELTREKSVCIPRRGLSTLFSNHTECPLSARIEKKSVIENGSEIIHTTVRCDNRTLTAVNRRDPDVDTLWTLEHLVKDVDDLKAYLTLPMPLYTGTINIETVISADKALGDSGTVLIDMGDPLCAAASLFPMDEYLVIAMTEKELFHELLQRFASIQYPLVRKASEALPGRLWRVVGAEYASAPYLPPNLFREFVTEYDKPIVKAIQANGGYARIHSHGRLAGILDHIVETGCDALDPIEPPPQGDVELSFVRERYGKQLVLFGNLEISDMETLPTPVFREKVKRALAEGRAGEGRGFVLMPSASPYGRKLSPLTMSNYEAVIEEVENFPY